MTTDIAKAAARRISEYLLTGMHHNTPEGQAEMRKIIDQELVAHPSKALRALALEAIDGRCPSCGDRRRIEIEI